MTELPHEPWFVGELPSGNGGVDFLGLREANLQLMSEFFPGINNVTSNIRPYSVMSWMVWAFLQSRRENGEETVRHDDFERFREKIEVLFNWGHQLAGEGLGLAGNAQVCPAADWEVPLTFVGWQRRVSWLDAVNYGPSLKDESGLGFLHKRTDGFYAINPVGAALGQALEASLRGAGVDYDKLLSAKDCHATKAFAEQVHLAWNCANPSNEEAHIFGQAFYAPDEMVVQGKARRSARGRRSAAIELIRESLRLLEQPASADEVRRAMACRILPSNAQITDLSAVKAAQNLWQVLQLRQAQRLAFEGLFGWCERKIATLEANDSEQLVASIRELMCDDSAGEISDAWVTEQLVNADNSTASEQCWDVPGLNGSEQHNLFEHVANLLREVRLLSDEVPVRSLRLLMLVVVATERMAAEPFAAHYLNVGGYARVSLMSWAEHIRRIKERPLSYFLTHLIENFLLSQHFGVAAIRGGENRQRLRLTIEDVGLVSLLPSAGDAWIPALTADRLEAALSLMADAGFVMRDRAPSGHVRYVAAVIAKT